MNISYFYLLFCSAGTKANATSIFLHAGGSSRGCPENAGAAGTFYDNVPRSLTVSNHNKSTSTDTLLLDLPQPLLTNVYIRNHAKAAVPLLWSRVQVGGVHLNFPFSVFRESKYMCNLN